jgi:hypothetical protein
MITLAVAAAFQTLASQLSAITGGEDGLTFRVPEQMSPSFEPFESEVFGLLIDGRIISYYGLLVVALVLLLVMLRIVNSPFGRVLQAIRENDFRAEASLSPGLSRRRTLSLFATLAGACSRAPGCANGPDTSLSFSHARHPADRDRRHGHDLRGGRQRALRGTEHLRDLMRLGAGQSKACRSRSSCRPIAGCCGWACCSCCVSITSPAASSAS